MRSTNQIKNRHKCNNTHKNMSIIISLNTNNLFGTSDNDLAYCCNDDLKRFSVITQAAGNAVMGRKTFESLGKPLADRMNVVLTNNADFKKKTESLDFGGNVRCMSSIEEVFRFISNPIFIGGAQVVYELLNSNYKFKINTIYLTRYDHPGFESGAVKLDIDFNTLPGFEVLTQYRITRSKVKSRFGSLFISIDYITYTNTYNNYYEFQYLEQMKSIMNQPRFRETRNAKTKATFGLHLKYDCRDGRVPLITTKKMAWKTCIKELLWFLQGKTDNQSLEAMNVKIWKGNSSREFLDSRGLTTYPEGTLGPIYGYQWRHWGYRYVDGTTDYTNQGIDQLIQCEEMLKTDPYSRRMIFSAWNVSDLEKMALPPCHILAQFFVDDDKRLNLQFYQRSGDMFLGIPFNMFSYSVLLHIMSKRTGFEPGFVHHCIGDAHVYESHFDAVHEQLKQTIKTAPKIIINGVKEFEKYIIDDFELENYTQGPKIVAPMIP